MFGLTECKRVCYLPPEEVDRGPSSVGKAIPNCEVWIEDGVGQESRAGRDRGTGHPGANVMRGYWNAPELSVEYVETGPLSGRVVLVSGDYFLKDEETAGISKAGRIIG